ncbi:discoidin, CUB and LCCL domain-containing protein 2-like [Rhipicephalus microplus]
MFRSGEHLSSAFFRLGATILTLLLGATRCNGSCDQVIMSNSSKNGTITSPNYPNPYPPSTRCNYHFQGEGKERVQIKFTDFDLYMPHEGIKE